MMASTTVGTIRVRTKFRWWFWPAFHLYRFTCWLGLAEPDELVVLKAARRAILWRWPRQKWEPVFND